MIFTKETYLRHHIIINPQFPLLLTIRLPSVLIKPIIEIIRNISTRLPPRLIFDGVEIELVHGNSVDETDSFKVDALCFSAGPTCRPRHKWGTSLDVEVDWGTAIRVGSAGSGFYVANCHLESFGN